MSKIHYTSEYNFPLKGKDFFLTPCGIDSRKHHIFISSTIIEERVNCKNCLKILKAKGTK